jgi:hypothetical protein
MDCLISSTSFSISARIFQSDGRESGSTQRAGM